MPNYKLTYFDVTGLGEPIRLLFHYGGVKFEDHRITFEEWPNIKPKMPMEQIPILEIDGKVYYQSTAIGRYLAKKFGLYGSNELEAMEIDIIVGDVEDYRLNVTNYYREEDPTRKSMLKEVALEKLEFYLKRLEERVKKNGGYFVGNKMTWADIHFAGISEIVGNVLEIDVFKGYPTLKKLNETVRSNPKIKAYLDKRPKTRL